MALLAWILIFGGFVTLAGVGDFIEHLGAITWEQFGLIALAVSVGVVAMGTCLYVIARNLGLGLSPLRTILLNTTVSLAHNLTPFGQAGGAPIGAAILAQHSDGKYEECLAALSVKDVVSFTPAILVFVFGGAYLVLYEQSIPDRLRPLFGAFALLVVLVCLAVLTVHRYPARMRAVLGRIGWAIHRLSARFPLLPTLDEDDVHRRIATFADSIAQVATDRPTVVLASAMATTAFVAQGTLLWIALQAVGVDISIALAVFVVPVSLMASGLPLPGGSGGVEAVQILLIVTTIGAQATPTITAVVLSRGLVFWTPIVLGSVTLFAFQLQGTVLDRQV